MKNHSKLFFKVIGIISFCIPITVSIFIINWFFNIIPIPKLQGMMLLATLFTSPIGIVLALIALLGYRNKIVVWALILNIALLFLPSSYFYLGTILFGP